MNGGERMIREHPVVVVVVTVLVCILYACFINMKQL